MARAGRTGPVGRESQHGRAAKSNEEIPFSNGELKKQFGLD
jgi:hypothetical protein